MQVLAPHQDVCPQSYEGNLLKWVSNLKSKIPSCHEGNPRRYNALFSSHTVKQFPLPNYIWQKNHVIWKTVQSICLAELSVRPLDLHQGVSVGSFCSHFMWAWLSGLFIFFKTELSYKTTCNSMGINSNFALALRAVFVRMIWLSALVSNFIS